MFWDRTITLTVFYFVRASLQDRLDPLKDFCRRFGHATTVIDNRLFIDGGLINWNPITENPQNYSNPYLLYNDLRVSTGGMPQLYTNLSKNSTVPAVSGGVLWSDTTNKVFYQFGGEYQDSPRPIDVLSAFDTVLNQWNSTNVSDNFNQVSWGAGVSVNHRAEGYYLGGWMNNKTTPGWSGPPLATSRLIRYNMVQNRITNITGPDDTGRAEGVMVYLPASDDGLLIYFGGVLDPYRNSTMTAFPMDTIHIYDMLSANWYTQKASGDVPASRRRFCAGVTWPDDHSSYNIYLYGGLGVPPNTTAFDDVYILSLPSFRWIKWWPTAPGSGRPHHSMSCNVVNRTQMLIIGGTFPGDDDCDAQDLFGTHNLNLGANGPKKSMWDSFYSNITTYQVPAEIVSIIGGGPSGGAKVIEPQQSWNNRDLLTYFSRVAGTTSRTPTRAIPSATGTSHHDSGLTGRRKIGLIAGAVLGGLLLLAVVLGIILCLLHRKQKQRRSMPPAPAELHTDQAHELGTEAKNHTRSMSEQRSISQTYYYSPGSGHYSSPHSPPALPPVELHAADTPDDGRPTPYREASYPSNSPGQSPPGVFPLGPYYTPETHRMQSMSLNNQPTHAFQHGDSTPQSVNRQVRGEGGWYSLLGDNGAPAVSNPSNTSTELYSQPLDENSPHSSGLGASRDGKAQSPHSSSNTRKGRSKFFEASG
ncbi:hypothetical protein EJ08DRAFT_723414 [Tothia fuscella]|uniref:Cell wall anchored protein n=1 Tax=Tothia fuscella TaxID=1048955 RepID=A0A9P4NK79_9PEZI|nr:hypothetical protein EJ08DRAFT_723414 [Tothia fuscella]